MNGPAEKIDKLSPFVRHLVAEWLDLDKVSFLSAFVYVDINFHEFIRVIIIGLGC